MYSIECTVRRTACLNQLYSCTCTGGANCTIRQLYNRPYYSPNNPHTNNLHTPTTPKMISTLKMAAFGAREWLPSTTLRYACAPAC
jgi:hypothetical protein